jgi:SAM-dependent methyltransferase
VIDREQVGREARQFFDALWSAGDPWDIAATEVTQRTHARLASLLEGRRYGRALEIGCGAGIFTRRLAGLADSVLALDIAPAAIESARKAGLDPAAVEFRVANIMQCDVRAEGPWDLVVMTEMVYFLGWLYPFFDVAWLASELLAATADGGRLVLANTQLGMEHPLMLPWIIRTYHDLFRNVGYRVEAEEILRGAKDGVELEILISLFGRPLS